MSLLRMREMQNPVRVKKELTLKLIIPDLHTEEQASDL